MTEAQAAFDAIDWPTSEDRDDAARFVPFVQRGITWLDVMKPWWHTLVDPDFLDMTKVRIGHKYDRGCIMAHLHIEGADALAKEWFGTSCISNDCSWLGFALSSDSYLIKLDSDTVRAVYWHHYGMHRYGILTRLWKSVIVVRQNR